MLILTAINAFTVSKMLILNLLERNHFENSFLIELINKVHSDEFRHKRLYQIRSQEVQYTFSSD